MSEANNDNYGYAADAAAAPNIAVLTQRVAQRLEEHNAWHAAEAVEADVADITRRLILFLDWLGSAQAVFLARLTHEGAITPCPTAHKDLIAAWLATSPVVVP